MQQWGTNYWETYSPVVCMVTVHLILLLARINKFDSKAVDFVLAFPQAELDVDIWIYLPIGFQADAENESKCYILKLNKSLYGLKQGSLNWCKKLKQGLIDRGFHPSVIDPCLYFKKGMMIITYIDDCIIVSNSMKDINTFVKSIKDGIEGYVLTDEGDINKFLGIEIKEITKNKFKLSQSFLIEQIVNQLGVGQNEFDVHTKTKITPVGKPLLNSLTAIRFRRE
jgi:hypothetical protein